jgi:hypothetical protein
MAWCAHSGSVTGRAGRGNGTRHSIHHTPAASGGTVRGRRPAGGLPAASPSPPPPPPENPPPPPPELLPGGEAEEAIRPLRSRPRAVPSPPTPASRAPLPWYQCEVPGRALRGGPSHGRGEPVGPGLLHVQRERVGKEPLVPLRVQRGLPVRTVAEAGQLLPLRDAQVEPEPLRGIEQSPAGGCAGVHQEGEEQVDADQQARGDDDAGDAVPRATTRASPRMNPEATIPATTVPALVTK